MSTGYPIIIQGDRGGGNNTQIYMFMFIAFAIGATILVLSLNGTLGQLFKPVTAATDAATTALNSAGSAINTVGSSAEKIINAGTGVVTNTTDKINSVVNNPFSTIGVGNSKSSGGGIILGKLSSTGGLKL